VSDALVVTLIVGVALVAVAAAAALTRATTLVDTELRFRSPLDADGLRATRAPAPHGRASRGLRLLSGRA